MLAIEPRMGVLTRETEVAAPILMDVKMMEMTLTITSPALPILAEEEVQVVELLVLALSMSWPLLRWLKK